MKCTSLLTAIVFNDATSKRTRHEAKYQWR